MPLYDYYCNNCKVTIELLVSLSNKIQLCPVCKQNLEVKFTPSTQKPILTGNGFYETDYVKSKKI